MFLEQIENLGNVKHERKRFIQKLVSHKKIGKMSSTGDESLRNDINRKIMTRFSPQKE